jgi:ATP-binding cassette subfamily C protein
VGERVLYDAIEQMKAANITVIIITHRMGILAATSKIAIMQDGTVSAFGDSQEIFDRYLSRPHIPSSENASAQVDVSPEPRSRVRRTRKRLNGLAAQSDGPAP